MSLRTSILLSVASLLIVIPNTQAASLQQSLDACRAISNGVERLACYDAINASDLSNKRPMPERMDKSVTDIVEEKQQQKANEVAQQSEPAQAKTPVAKPKPESQFGLKVKSEVQALEDISDIVVDVTKSARGKKVIHMKSGAVWQQVDSAYFKLEEGMAVYVERGALGSFYLSHEGVNRRIKVKRIK